jgi:hypothetical protein
MLVSCRSDLCCRAKIPVHEKIVIWELYATAGAREPVGRSCERHGLTNCRVCEISKKCVALITEDHHAPTIGTPDKHQILISAAVKWRIVDVIVCQQLRVLRLDVAHDARH